jgi:Xaa-Pro aminopeptidase
MKNSSLKTLIEHTLLSLQEKLDTEWYLFEEYYDLYYLTRLKMSKATLIVGPKSALFVDPKYEESARNQFPFSVYPIESLRSWMQEQHIPTLGFDPAKTSYERYLQLKDMTSLLKPLENPLKEIRMIKSSEEIVAIKKSAELLMKGFSYLRTLLKEGISEKEIAKAFEVYVLLEGADKLAFEPIIAFGANSAMPHHRAGETKLTKNTLILVDIGVVVDHYCSDMTRVLTFGEVDPRLLHLGKLVKDTHAEVLKHVRAGMSVHALDYLARECIKAHGDYPILHGLGHSIGLEVHEYPSINARISKELVLKENMVVTIEPGLYLPGIGGVRYEDMILIEEKGFRNFYENLSSATVRF